MRLQEVEWFEGRPSVRFVPSEEGGLFVARVADGLWGPAVGQWLSVHHVAVNDAHALEAGSMEVMDKYLQADPERMGVYKVLGKAGVMLQIAYRSQGVDEFIEVCPQPFEIAASSPLANVER